MRTRAAALLLLVACGGPGAVREPAPAAATPVEHEPAPAAAAAAADDADALRIAAIERAVNDTRDLRHECWAFAAASDFRVAGRVVLRLTFSDGDTAAARVVSDGPAHPRLTACLVELYQAYRWPPVFEPGQAVELPFDFRAPRGQYTIRARHVEPAELEGGKLAAWVLLDERATGNGAASLSMLLLQGGVDVPLHRHTSAELLYVRSGEGVVYGVDGVARGVRVAAGHGIYIPAGVPHGLVQRGAEPLSLVQLTTPAGPEQRYRDPGGPALGTTPVPAAEARRMARDAARPIVVTEPERHSIAGDTASVRLYFDLARTGNAAASMSLFTAQPQARVPLHRHAAESEFLLVISGRGTMTVDGEPYAIEPMTAVQVPANLEHAFEVVGDEPVIAVQFYTPAGPEQRFKRGP